MGAAKGVLFLCVANSARSQMAEGWAHRFAPEGVVVQSAGSEPGRVNPLAIRVMQEVGIDLSAHASKPVDDVDRSQVDTVITLCAEEVCPAYLGKAERLHWPHDDPAGAGSTEEEQLVVFRRVRDEIGGKVRAFFGAGEATP